MNRPEIKISSYKPPSAPQEAKENKTLDIKPKTGHEKSKSISQHPEPKMVSKGDTDLGDGVKRIGEFIDEQPEQPNQQLMLIQTIQNLTTCISNSITKLPESELRDTALEDIATFEKTTLFSLQKEYE